MTQCTDENPFANKKPSRFDPDYERKMRRYRIDQIGAGTILAIILVAIVIFFTLL